MEIGIATYKPTNGEKALVWPDGKNTVEGVIIDVVLEQDVDRQKRQRQHLELDPKTCWIKIDTHPEYHRNFALLKKNTGGNDGA